MGFDKMVENSRWQPTCPAGWIEWWIEWWLKMINILPVSVKMDLDIIGFDIIGEKKRKFLILITLSYITKGFRPK